jgi:hypothetical protein
MRLFVSIGGGDDKHAAMTRRGRLTTILALQENIATSAGG